MPYKSRDRQRRAQREWVARRRAEWIEENGPCVQCGSDLHLEVHHRDPTTKATHRVWSWAVERRDAELAKCEVLCRRCHQRITVAAGTTSPLSETQVWAILRRRARGESPNALSADFGVGPSAIRKITRGIRWARVHRRFHAVNDPSRLTGAVQ